MRTLVIADIHGGNKALVQCLERSSYNPKEDKIIFLGDYVDGWSESAEVVQTILDLKKDNLNVITLLGNHDAWCKDWLNLGSRPVMWQQHGGVSTIKSYIDSGLITSKEHEQFFNRCLPYYIDEKDRVFVHAGITSHHGVGREPYATNYYWDRTFWTIALATKNTKQPLPKVLRSHKEFFIGHTPTINWNYEPGWFEGEPGEPISVPMNSQNVWNLDTGGGWPNGRVTIMDIDTKAYWQSDLLTDLYDELGRGNFKQR